MEKENGCKTKREKSKEENIIINEEEIWVRSKRQQKQKKTVNGTREKQAVCCRVCLPRLWSTRQHYRSLRHHRKRIDKHEDSSIIHVRALSKSL